MKNRIKVARAEVNITQGELAEKIGVTRQAVNSIELGKYVPSTLLALINLSAKSAGSAGTFSPAELADLR